jgi:hypothetical protein
MHNRIALLFCSLFLIALAAHSQISISPYSHYGLGDLFGQSGTRSFGMGQVGIGAYDQSSINRLNPASYADLQLTTFDFNGFVTYSKQESNYNTQSLGTSGFHNASLAFSNRKGFGLVVGLAPYSSLGYDVRTRDSILVDTAMEAFSANYTASGGLSQLYFGVGLRFLKRVQAGVNLTYAFGTNQYEWTSVWDNTSISTGYAEKRATMRGFAPQLGLQYGDTIKLKVRVDRLKEIAQTQKELEEQLKAIAAERVALEEEAAKITTWEAGKQAKADELGAQKERLDGTIKSLMANERENAKEIGKLQEHSYRIEKKRKDILQEIRSRKKENTDAVARLNVRVDKIEQRKAALAQEKRDIEAGKREGTESKTKRYLVRLGGTFDPGVSLSGHQVIRYSNSGIFDTLRLDTGVVALPTRLGFGFSIARPNKWMLAADVALQDWTRFSYFNETNNLTQALSAHVGGEWIPDLGSTKFAKKIAYRLGGYYNQTFLTLQNQPIKEIGVTAGVGLPIGYYNPIGQSYSRINLGVSLSRRGTLESNLLEEMTIQFRLGVNLNDIWFIKRPID